MAVWSYQDSTDEPETQELDLTFLQSRSPPCQYCGYSMEMQLIEDRWNFTADEYLGAHQKGTNFEWLIKEQGVPLSHLELSTGEPWDNPECRRVYCKACGWWVLEKRVLLSAKRWQVWEHIYATSGKLKALDLTDVSLPIREIRSYLTAKYSDRFLLHPRKLEEVIGSIFSDLGFESRLTTYSNDGGIDVVLSGPTGDLVGVQVKRYKNSIGVEQIRSFLGALLVNNCTRGVFVTTSRFQRGAHKLADHCNKYYKPIELSDADRLLSTLKAAQASTFNASSLDAPSVKPPLHMFTTLHLNSL